MASVVSGGSGGPVAPGISCSHTFNEIKAKFFGVNQLETNKAMLVLGTTELDVMASEHLMAKGPGVVMLPREDENVPKAEKLLGYSRLQMYYLKAMEVLGISSEELDEDCTRYLGGLGYHNTPAVSPVNEPELSPMRRLARRLSGSAAYVDNSSTKVDEPVQRILRPSSLPSGLTVSAAASAEAEAAAADATPQDIVLDVKQDALEETPAVASLDMATAEASHPSPTLNVQVAV